MGNSKFALTVNECVWLSGQALYPSVGAVRAPAPQPCTGLARAVKVIGCNDIIYGFGHLLRWMRLWSLYRPAVLFVCLFCRCPKTIYWPFLAPASWNTTLNKTLKKPVAHSVPEPAEDSLLSWCKTSVWSINKYSVVVDGLSLPAIWWHLSLPVRDIQHELLLWAAKQTLSTLGEFGLLLTLRCLRFCLLSLSIWSEKCRLKSDSSSGWFTRCSAPPAGKLKAVNKVWPQN